MGSDETIVFSTTDPIIFAFAASTVSFLNGHFAPGGNSEVAIDLDPARNLKAAPSPSFHSDTKAPWALMTVASGFFKDWQTNNQGWVGRSADLLEETLAPLDLLGRTVSALRKRHR